MATQKADYYETLGVSRSRARTRSSARSASWPWSTTRPQCGPWGGDAVQEINEAYEVLSDSEKRAAYDRFGHAGLDGAFGARGFEGFGPFGGFGDIFDAFFGAAQTRRRTPRRGADIQVRLDLTFEEAAFGVNKSVTINRTELCARCDGLRAEPGTEPQRCPTCDGTGGCGASSAASSASSSTSRPATAAAVTAKSSHTLHPMSRERPGAGTRTLDVRIPAGVDGGSQIRLTNEGELGTYGPRGNAYVLLNVKEHPSSSAMRMTCS
jgi:molecular chaperone DnaJ